MNKDKRVTKKMFDEIKKTEIVNFNEIESTHRKIELLDYLIKKNSTNESLINYEKSFVKTFTRLINDQLPNFGGDLMVAIKTFATRFNKISHLLVRLNQSQSDGSKVLELMLRKTSDEAFAEIGSLDPELLKNLAELTEKRVKADSVLQKIGTEMFCACSNGVAKEELADKVLMNLFLILGENHPHYHQVKDLWLSFKEGTDTLFDRMI